MGSPTDNGDDHDHSHGHHDGCDHDHHDHAHDHHDHGHPPAPPPPGGLRGLFNRVSGFYDRHGGKPPALLLTTLLLGTTALATPALNTLIGAGAVLAGSLWLLKKTSDIVLNHTEAIGRKAGITPLALGLGLSALTAVPEIGVALVSMAQKTADIGIGTLVGSNIAHAFLVLGAVAAISPIGRGHGLGWKYNTLAMAGATGAFAAQIMTDTMIWPAALGLGGMTALYGYGLRATLKRDAKTMNRPVTDLIHHHGEGSSCNHDHGHAHDHTAEKASRLKNAFYTIGGLGGLVAASDLVVRSATAAATGTGMSDAAISTLAISFGAVLPELMMSVNAAKRKNTELAVGNILGCNIFNVLLVGTAMSAVGVSVPDSLSPSSPLGLFNLAALGASAGLMTTTLLAQKGAMKRWQGYVALGLYGAYMAGTVALGKMPETREPSAAPIVTATRQTPSLPAVPPLRTPG